MTSESRGGVMSYEDPLAPARGILIGVTVSIVFWAIVFVLVMGE